ncbi:hypothetical protein [Arthrobacter sp. M4]|nr:hypothetical protein [Arthrobacter sp. M4]
MRARKSTTAERHRQRDVTVPRKATAERHHPAQSHGGSPAVDRNGDG